MSRFYVDTTRCNCHPETCCHGDWSIYLEGRRVQSYFSRKEADIISKAYNEERDELDRLIAEKTAENEALKAELKKYE